MPQIDLTKVHLSEGSHSPDGKYCVMELYTVVHGLPWSDQPEGVPGTIRRALIRLNDRMDDGSRQRLIPYVEKIAGLDRSRELERRRAFIAADFAVRRFAPIALRARGRVADAERLEAVAEIVDVETARLGRAAAADAAYDAAAAAYDAAYDAAAAAAYAYAADAAAYAADAAADAAAAYDAAYDAAAAAAYAAASSTRSAVWDVALAMVDAMIAATI